MSVCYHASPIPDLRVLRPHVSNHGKPLVYFSQKRENVLVYLSNAVEKYCLSAGIPGPYQKWGPYGFNRDGLLILEEYYPDALSETYRGARGYIYTVRGQELTPLPDIPFAAMSSREVPIESCQSVPDAYEALLQAEREGRLLLRRYETLSPEKLRWIRETVRQEYAHFPQDFAYRAFLRAKFPDAGLVG